MRVATMCQKRPSEVPVPTLILATLIKNWNFWWNFWRWFWRSEMHLLRVQKCTKNFGLYCKICYWSMWVCQHFPNFKRNFMLDISTVFLHDFLEIRIRQGSKNMTLQDWRRKKPVCRLVSTLLILFDFKIRRERSRPKIFQGDGTRKPPEAAAPDGRVQCKRRPASP